MAIKKVFKGRVIKYPSGSGLSSKPCPNCGTPEYSIQYGMDKDEKPYFKKFCFKCKWGESCIGGKK